MNRIVKCASCSDTITVDEHSSIRDYICSERCANNDLWNKAKEERLGYFQIGREEGRREILGELQELLARDRHSFVFPTVRIHELIEKNTPKKGGK